MNGGLLMENGSDVQVAEIWDETRLGRIIAGARTREGYDRMSDLTLEIYRTTGMRWHENTLYDVEGGKRLPNVSLLLALMLTLQIHFSELVPAIVEDKREAVRRLLS